MGAVEKEDYDLAADLKPQLKALEEKLASALEADATTESNADETTESNADETPGENELYMDFEFAVGQANSKSVFPPIVNGAEVLIAESTAQRNPKYLSKIQCVNYYEAIFRFL